MDADITKNGETCRVGQPAIISVPVFWSDTTICFILTGRWGAFGVARAA